MTDADAVHGDAGDKMLKRAVGWIPTLQERSAEIDSLRQLPQDLADALAADGFYRTLVPPALGGMGLPPAIVAAVVDALRRLGVRDIDPPLTPFTVWKAIADAKQGDAV